MKRFLGLALAIALPFQALYPLTLEEAIASFMKSYPGIFADYESVVAAIERIDAARSGYRPNIYALGQLGAARLNSSILDETFRRFPRSATFNVTQPLYRGGRTVAALRRSKQDYLAESYLYEEAVGLLLQETATVYFDVIKEEEILKANESTVRFLSRELKAVQDRFDVGDVTLTDLSQSQSRLSGAEARVTEAKGRLEIAKAVLERLIGIPVDHLERPTFDPEMPTSQEELELRVHYMNKELKARSNSYNAALAFVKEIRGEMLPELNLDGYVQHNRDQTIAGEYANEVVAELNLTLPIYTQGLPDARMREAEALARQEYFQMEEFERLLKERSVRAYQALITFDSQITSFESQVKTNEVALDGVKQEESAGLRTVLDVLNAEAEVLNARVNLIEAVRNKFAAQLEILQLQSALYERFFCRRDPI